MSESGVFALVDVRKVTTSTSTLQRVMTTMSESRVIALVDGRKNITILGTSSYRSGMQQSNAACTRAPLQCKSCPCATCSWLLHPTPILVSEIVLTLCKPRSSEVGSAYAPRFLCKLPLTSIFGLYIQLSNNLVSTSEWKVVSF